MLDATVLLQPLDLIWRGKLVCQHVMMALDLWGALEYAIDHADY